MLYDGRGYEILCGMNRQSTLQKSSSVFGDLQTAELMKSVVSATIAADRVAAPSFLYNLLTSTDSRSIQQHSAFYTDLSSANDALSGTTESFPKRSNSLTLRRVEPDDTNSAARFESRPSSVPQQQLHQMLGGGLFLTQLNFLPPKSLVVSSNHRRPEPLDLCLRADCSDAEISSSTAVQPMLRTILQRGVTKASEHIDTAATAAAANEVVQLSRKQAHVVRARVVSWLKEAVDFALDKSVFVALPAHVQLTLLQRAWPSLLLLSMAEHDCTFAVSPCHKMEYSMMKKAADHSCQPTRAFADNLLRVIELAHCLGLDETSFQLLRLAVILKGGNEAEVSLIEVHTEILGYLQLHMKSIGRSHHHFADVLWLLAQLADIDRTMIESLLCGQLPNSCVNTFLKERFAPF